MLCVFIPAAGLGERLKEKTKYINKSLINVSNQTAITRIIENYPRKTKFIIALGYKGNYLKQYLSLAHSNTNISYVRIRDYYSNKSGLGLTLLKSEKLLQNPFIFNPCDSIINHKIDKISNNWIGYSVNKNHHHYRTLLLKNNVLAKIYEKNLNTVKNPKIYTGVAGVYDYKLFWNYMHEGGVKAIKEGEVYALKKLIHKKLKAVKLNWIDIGNLESLNLAKKALHKKNDPVILEKSNENIWFVKNNVIKFSDDDKFISKRIKRSIILKGYVPEIKKFTKNFYKYKKIEGIVFSKCVNKTNFEQLLDHSKKFWKLNNLNKVESLKFASNCYNFYKLKTNSRINEFLKKYNIKDKKNIINGSEVDKVKSLINRINWKELTNGIPVRNHGDFHFENIIFENNKNNFKFIDWRQDFDGVIKYGDIYYDLGKLLHGIIISHELIEKNMFKISHNKQTVNYSFKTKKNFNLIFDFFFNWLKKNNYNQKKTFILTSLIYLNIAPLHHYPYDNLLFYLGKNMLQSVLNDNYQAYIKND